MLTRFRKTTGALQAVFAQGEKRTRRLSPSRSPSLSTWKPSAIQASSKATRFAYRADKDTACPICLTTFYSESVKEKVAALPDCGHLFHLTCITKAYEAKPQNFCCPVCRKSNDGGAVDVTDIVYDNYYQDAYGHMLNK